MVIEKSAVNEKSASTSKWLTIIAIIAVLAILSTIVLTVLVVNQAPITAAIPVVTSATYTTATATKPITAKQVSYINGLAVKANRNANSFISAMFNGTTIGSLTTVQASKVIEALQAIVYATQKATP
ncbi:MAG: hypothetical protein NTV33_10920 [Coprothermobacterota bacterium]|nr:hypothetical protein [Coprothermobacterota bacterium]